MNLGDPMNHVKRNLVLTHLPHAGVSVFSLRQDAKHDFALKLFTFFDHLERCLRDKVSVILNMHGYFYLYSLHLSFRHLTPFNQNNLQHGWCIQQMLRNFLN